MADKLDSVCNYLDGFRRSRLNEQLIKTAFLAAIVISYNQIFFHCYRGFKNGKIFFEKNMRYVFPFSKTSQLIFNLSCGLYWPLITNNFRAF